MKDLHEQAIELMKKLDEKYQLKDEKLSLDEYLYENVYKFSDNEDTGNSNSLVPFFACLCVVTSFILYSINSDLAKESSNICCSCLQV